MKSLAALIALGACAPSLDAAVIYPGLPYQSPGAAGGSLLLDVYVPNPGMPMEPVTIVIVHGGSYSAGSRTDNRQLAIALADRGYPSICISYTLATPSAPSFPQPINDVLNSVRWVRTAGSGFGLPNRVFLYGHSAGATIVGTAATAIDHANTVFSPHPQPAPDRGYVIDGVIGLAGRYDILWNVNIGIPQTVVQYIGATPFASPDWLARYSSASAVSYAGPCSPPMVLFHGSNDTTVPVANSTRFADALTAASVPVQLNIVQGGGHGPEITGVNPYQQSITIAAAARWILERTTASCGRVPLTPPAGSCCPGDGTCVISSNEQCPRTGNSDWVQGGTCQPSPCPPVAACCAGAACSVTVESTCQGAWLASSAACSPGLCDVFGILGVCCFGSSCFVTTRDQCQSVIAVFFGGLESCAPIGAPRPCRVADFNKDELVNVADVFAYVEAWFAGDPAASLQRSVNARPTLQDLFGFLDDWFLG